MDKNTFKEILHRYNTGAASPEERAFVEAYYAAFDKRPDLIGELSPDEQKKMEQQLLNGLRKRMGATPQRTVQRTLWLRIAAAIILLLGIGAYFSGVFKKEAAPVAVVHTQKDVPAPVSNRAIITLADGSQVFLDSTDNGQLAQLGNARLVKLANGQIAYETIDGQQVNNLQYNTLTNPRGSKVIDMKLSDGSRVWLNAGSSITYPVLFAGSERKVELTGEGYFEIARKPSQPFYVEARGMEVKVLGTHFNVNAYEDEHDIKVTLLEGAVKVSSFVKSDAWKDTRNTVTLKPGQQAFITPNQKPEIENEVDLETVIAWKNGKFDFGQGTDIRIIMRQVSRWYDVDIEYHDNISQEFGGGISREANVSDLLKNFELTGKVHFIIEGKKIIVKK